MRHTGTRGLSPRPVAMVHSTNTGALTLGYANSRPPPARGRVTSSRRPWPRPGVVAAVVAGAIGWLLLGCSGLVWTIAFTADQRPLVLALAVFALGFVAPSVLATVVAYRIEEQQGTADDD